MAIYDGSSNGGFPSKPAIGADSPDSAIDQADWQHAGPLVTAQQLRDEFLFGIPLVSPNRDPITGKAAVMTDPLVDKIIKKAVTIAAQECRIDIMPVQRVRKLPFDRAEYEAWGYMRLPERPVSSLDSLQVVPSNEQAVYTVPLEWVDAIHLRQGMIFIIPLTVVMANGGVVNSQSAGGALFLSLLGNKPWVPAFWEVTYTSGFRSGAIPVIVNELIGTIAAMTVLSQLAAAHAMDSSFSLGLDGASQSISTAGPEIFAQRMKELADDRQKYVKQIRAWAGTTIFSSNV